VFRDSRGFGIRFKWNPVSPLHRSLKKQPASQWFLSDVKNIQALGYAWILASQGGKKP
jgi:hypothetical protein